MAAPMQNEIVVVAEGDEFEVHVAVADGDTPVGDFLAAAVGRSVEHVRCDDLPFVAATPLRELPLVRGSRLEIVASPSPAPVCAILAVAGEAAGGITLLGPGVHRLGSVDVGVQGRGDQGGTASLYVDVDGAVQIDPGGCRVLVGGEPVDGIEAIPPQTEFAVGADHYRLMPLPNPTAAQGTIAFNRPPRAEFPASLPRLVAPATPPEARQPTRFGWGALLIPLLMGGLMAFLWNPMMAIFALLSPAMLLANYLEDKREAKRSSADAAASIATEMAEFGRRLEALFHGARALAWRATPGPAQLLEQVGRADSRLWQRRHDHPDFMEIGIGVGDVAWSPDIVPLASERAAAANAEVARYPVLPQVPVTVELASGGTLGIAGHRRRGIEIARWLLIQAATHHGPADLSIVIISDDPTEWDCLKWLPHLQVNGDSAQLAVVPPGEAGDDLLAPLLTGHGESSVFELGGESMPKGPAVLVVSDVADVTAAAAATLRRVLGGEGSGRRCGIALGRTVEELPSSCTDIVTVAAAGDAVLERPSRAHRVDSITSWRLSARAARNTGRKLGRYLDPDLRIAGAGLADVVHLLDLISLGERTSDAVLRRWDAAGPIPRCAAPIGATAEGPLVVDWVSDGPHGLLAGTTGAGKSELLRTLVASLAATVDPEHLNFVLIDYKGGSAFDSCAGLPHTVGMVTDLDGHLAHRALTCLEAELRYREETLREVGAGDIDDYHALNTDRPLPRLLVVIDEFAALAKELPDFMASLVDVAQRGRSLGVHLLLATQRPNGVINENIRANTNLRLSLRVQDAQDSTDVVGTADAAALPRTRPGRGYLRRGPGDVVAFQSALVTGCSQHASTASSLRPFTVVPEPAVSATAAPLPDLDPQSDLDVLVAMIQEAATKAGMRPARLPWPDPLPEQISYVDAIGEHRVGASEIVIGLADEPHRQRQRPFTWDSESNLLIYGVQGCGTSTALATALTAACLRVSPHDLHAYVLDFDDQRLKDLEVLPHVGAVVGSGERDRQLRLLRYLQWEVAERRELAAADPAALSERPRIIVALDNFGGFRSSFDEPGDMAAKDSFTRLVADGPGVGIVVVATAKQPMDVPTNVASLISSKLVMRLADRHEYSGLGVAITEPSDIAGRAFESGTSRELQFVSFSNAERQEIAAAMSPPAPERSPWALELLATEVKVPDIVEEAAVYELEWKIPIGIGDDRLRPVGWSLREGDHVLVSGPARSGKSTALVTIATVLRHARPDVRITALTPRRSTLAECPEVDMLIADPEQLQSALAAVDDATPHAILIDDAEEIDDATGVLAALVAQRHPHRHVFAAGAADMLRGLYGHWTQAVRRSRLGLALKPNITNDGDLWQATLPRYGPSFFPPGRGYLLAEGKVELTQAAWQ